jgi:ATP-dependent phosphofructokinase / diphosphate-dependent phosphofructokinase
VSSEQRTLSPRRIAINTGGGDAPGLNAVIRAVVLAAHNRGWEVYGIRDGYNGLFLPDEYPEGGLIHLTPSRVRGITHLGGTILGTTNRGNPLKYPMLNNAGELVEVDRSDELIEAFQRHGIDSLIAIGGDGSLDIAHALSQKGLNVVGVPKTIDNDLENTVVTFGFDSAVSFATECIDRLHSTAEAHRRTMVVEVMGRYAGWIALLSGVAATADVILIPEIPYDINKVVEKVEQRYRSGAKFAIVVVAEGAKPAGGSAFVVERELGRAERLGGVGQAIGEQIRTLTQHEVRVTVLGHLLRGGTPTTRDRQISLRFGAAAVRALEEGRSDIMVALDPPTVRCVPLEEVAGRMKLVPLDSDTVLTARDLGISFGD